MARLTVMRRTIWASWLIDRRSCAWLYPASWLIGLDVFSKRSLTKVPNQSRCTTAQAMLAISDDWILEAWTCFKNLANLCTSRRHLSHRQEYRLNMKRDKTFRGRPGYHAICFLRRLVLIRSHDVHHTGGDSCQFSTTLVSYRKQI